MNYTIELSGRKEGMPYNEFPFIKDGKVFYQSWNRMHTNKWSNELGFLPGGPKFSLSSKEKYTPNKRGIHVGKFPHLPTDEQFSDAIRMFFSLSKNMKSLYLFVSIASWYFPMSNLSASTKRLIPISRKKHLV